MIIGDEKEEAPLGLPEAESEMGVLVPTGDGGRVPRDKNSRLGEEGCPVGLMLDLTPLGTLGAWMVLPEGKTGFHPPRRTVIAQGYASHPRKGMYGHHLQARTARRRTGSCALLTANSRNHNSWQSGAQALVTINKGHDICTHDKIKAPHCGRRG